MNNKKDNICIGKIDEKNLFFYQVTDNKTKHEMNHNLNI